MYYLCGIKRHKMKFSFKTISEFNDYFKDEITCYRFMEDQRWQGTPVCPHCASIKKPYNVKARGVFKDIPSYRCSEKLCDLPFTIRTGSALEGSKVELRKWFQAMYEISISKKGISSHELAVRIGVSQKTAWFMNHRLRTAMIETNLELLTGTVEVDESYIGGKLSNMHEGKKAIKSLQPNNNKTIVMGMIERDGKVRTMVIPDTNVGTMRDKVITNVAKDARLITDSHRSYHNLYDTFDNHKMVKAVDGYKTNKLDHTNTIEGYWSILKRGIVGTFHFVSPQHLQRYCDEFSYRYNNRKRSTADNFAESIRQSAQFRITYRKLTGIK